MRSGKNPLKRSGDIHSKVNIDGVELHDANSTRKQIFKKSAQNEPTR